MSAQIILVKVAVAGTFVHWEARIGDLSLAKISGSETEARATAIQWVRTRHVVTEVMGDSYGSDRVTITIEGMV